MTHFCLQRYLECIFGLTTTAYHSLIRLLIIPLHFSAPRARYVLCSFYGPFLFSPREDHLIYVEVETGVETLRFTSSPYSSLPNTPIYT